MDSVGKILYEARAAKGITLLDAEKATSIRASYLDALEQDDYAKMPEEVFIKGIIRNYGNYLGLNGPELVDMYKAQRIGTVINADKIIVLDNGECVGMGTHKELLKNCDVYKEIALSQLSEEELENA